MGRQLMELYDEFADKVTACDDWLIKNGFPGCLSIFLAEGHGSPRDEPENVTWQAFQSALFVLEVALAQLLMSWGITPSAVAGHR